MSDATDRAKHLLSTLDRENVVAFSSVRGVLRDCIGEIEAASTEGALKDAVIVALRAWMAAENGHVDDWPNLIDALAELDSGTRSEDDD